MKKLMFIWFMVAMGINAESISNLFNVVGVEDGDTIYIVDNVGVKKRVKLIGIDAPEKGQIFYADSGTALANAVYNKTMTIVVDSVEKDKTLIATVYNEDGVNLNLAMVKFGYAWNCSTDKEFIDAEKSARSSQTGLWQYSSAMPPWDYREAVAKQQKLIDKQNRNTIKEEPTTQKISLNKPGEKAYTTQSFSSEPLKKSNNNDSSAFSFSDKQNGLSGPGTIGKTTHNNLNSEKTGKEGAIGSGVLESQLVNKRLPTTKKEKTNKKRKVFSLEDGKYKTGNY